MPKLNPLPAKKVIETGIRRFCKNSSKGKPCLFKKRGQNSHRASARHNKDVPIGTLHNIVVKQASLSIEKFNNL